jgi:hypothetical protein
MSVLLMGENSVSPSTPSSGERLIYPKADGWYQKNSAGIETKVQGANYLSDLLDVDITNKDEGDILIYNASTQKWVADKTNATVFGCSFSEASNAVGGSNATNTNVTYLTLESNVCEAGKKYRLGVFIVWAMSVTNQSFEASLTVAEGAGADVVVGQMVMRATTAGSQYAIPSSGFFYYTPATSAVCTIKIKYRVQSGTGTAYMDYGGIEWWRASL